MSAPQRILHLIDRLDGYGATRQLEVLSTSQIADGKTVEVLALRAAPAVREQLRLQGITCHVLDRRWRRDPIAAWRLATAVRTRNFDLLHLWGPDALSYWQSVERFLEPCSTIVSLADRVLLGSQAQPLPLGVDSAAEPTVSREALLGQQLLPEDAIILAVGGQLTRRLRVDEAIWAFELVRTLDESTVLLIFGDGPDRPRLERFCRLTSEPAAVRFFGYCDDFRSLVRVADVFWHFADDCPAPPLAVLEAQATGVPIVAKSSPGCRRIIDDKSTGHLVDDSERAVFARHTRKLLAEPQLARELANRAQEKIAQEYSLLAMLDRYRELYAVASKNAGLVSQCSA